MKAQTSASQIHLTLPSAPLLSQATEHLHIQHLPHPAHTGTKSKKTGVYHKPPHSLLLNALIFLLLLPLSVGMVGGHSLGEFLEFACD